MALDTGVSTIFSERSIFTTLSTASYTESGVAALSRGLRSALDPVGISELLGGTRGINGFSADAPSLFFRPLDLGLSNTLLLLAQSTGVGLDQFIQKNETATSIAAQEAFNTLERFGLNDSLPLIRNRAGSILTSTSFNSLLSEQAQTRRFQRIPAPPPPSTPLIPSVFDRPKEIDAFGTVYSSVPESSTVNTQFYKRIGLIRSGSYNLSDLILTNDFTTSTNFALRLLGESGGDGLGTIKDNFGNPISKNTIVSATDLGNYTYTAPENKNTDYLSLIELNDADTDGNYEVRGILNTITLTSSVDRQDSLDGNEKVSDFTFYAESDTATPRVILRISGLEGQGYTDTLQAIEDGDLRVKASETLPDGDINLAITDLYVSEGNDIIAVFAYQQAQKGLRINGIDVELRGLDPNLDVYQANVAAIFA